MDGTLGNFQGVQMPRPLNATPFITHKGVIEGPERERKGV